MVWNVIGEGQTNRAIQDDSDETKHIASITAKNGKIVIAVVDGEMMIRRLEKSLSRLTLISECAERSVLEISEFQNCEIWGVVTYVIKDVS